MFSFISSDSHKHRVKPIYAGSTRNEESLKHNFEKHTEIKTKDEIEPPRTGSYQPEILLHSFLKKNSDNSNERKSFSWFSKSKIYDFSVVLIESSNLNECMGRQKESSCCWYVYGWTWKFPLNNYVNFIAGVTIYKYGFICYLYSILIGGLQERKRDYILLIHWNLDNIPKAHQG